MIPTNMKETAAFSVMLLCADLVLAASMNGSYNNDSNIDSDTDGGQEIVANISKEDATDSLIDHGTDGGKDVANLSKVAQVEKASDSLISDVAELLFSNKIPSRWLIKNFDDLVDKLRSREIVSDKDGGNEIVANLSEVAQVEEGSDSFKRLRQRVGKGYALQPILEFLTPEKKTEVQLLKKKVYDEIIPGNIDQVQPWAEVYTMDMESEYPFCPNALVVDHIWESTRYGHVYVSSWGQNRILHITPEGVKSDVPNGEIQSMKCPKVLAVDPEGNLYVGGDQSICTYDHDYKKFVVIPKQEVAKLPIEKQMEKQMNGDDLFSTVQFDGKGNSFFLQNMNSDYQSYQIHKIEKDGDHIVLANFKIGENSNTLSNISPQFAVDRDGTNMYLLDYVESKIHHIDVSEVKDFQPKILKDEFGKEIEFVQINGITVDALGNLYVIDNPEDGPAIIFRLSREKEDGKVFWVKSKFAGASGGDRSTRQKDGPRQEAEFAELRAITNDSYITSSGELSGILYILDTECDDNTRQIISRIRMIPLSHDAVGRVEKLSRRQTEKN